MEENVGHKIRWNENIAFYIQKSIVFMYNLHGHVVKMFTSSTHHILE